MVFIHFIRALPEQCISDPTGMYLADKESVSTVLCECHPSKESCFYQSFGLACHISNWRMCSQQWGVIHCQVHLHRTQTAAQIWQCVCIQLSTVECNTITSCMSLQKGPGRLVAVIVTLYVTPQSQGCTARASTFVHTGLRGTWQLVSGQASQWQSCSITYPLVLADHSFLVTLAFTNRHALSHTHICHLSSEQNLQCVHACKRKHINYTVHMVSMYNIL